MRIGLVDLGDLDYTPITPLQRPLGGMQSGLSYLAVALAQRGHDVTLVNQTRTPGLYGGVKCVPLAQGLQRDCLDRLDAVISIACDAIALRRVGVTCPLVLWTGHNIDIPDVQNLAQPEERSSWDRIVLKSNWQADRYERHFKIDYERMYVLRNAISPCFEQRPRRASFFFETGRPPVLVYSSTPFRGLDILLKAFPLIQASVPGCTARIYSSMAVYQRPEEDVYRNLYAQCRHVDGVEYFGSFNQNDLAEAISGADILAYPSIFIETSCITLMEAMASGCLVVSNALGALPETGAGFGHFCTYPLAFTQQEFVSIYADFLVKAIAEAMKDPAGSRKKLEDQMAFARTNYTWSRRALEWEQFLLGLIAEAGSRRTTGTQSQSQIRQAFLGSVNGLEGKPIYVDLRDGRGRRLIEAGGNFNPPTLAIWHGLLGEDDWTHVIDVGANYGEMLANGKLPRAARVIAVEPNVRVLPFLRKTLSSLGGVTLLEVALSDREGHAEFIMNENWSGMSRIVQGGSTRRMVPTTTLGALLKNEGMPPQEMRVLVKIDVEGHEVNVLQGGIDMLPILRNFSALIEIAHMSEADMKWIVQNFDVFGFDPRTQRLQKIESLHAKDMKALSLYDQDAVIRRKVRDGDTIRSAGA